MIFTMGCYFACSILLHIHALAQGSDSHNDNDGRYGFFASVAFFVVAAPLLAVLLIDCRDVLVPHHQPARSKNRPEKRAGSDPKLTQHGPQTMPAGARAEKHGSTSSSFESFAGS